MKRNVDGWKIIRWTKDSFPTLLPETVLNILKLKKNRIKLDHGNFKVIERQLLPGGQQQSTLFQRLRRKRKRGSPPLFFCWREDWTTSVCKYFIRECQWLLVIKNHWENVNMLSIFLSRTGWGAWWSSWPWAPAEKRLTVDLWIGLAAVTDDELRDTVLLAIVLASMVDILDDDCWVNLFCVSGGVVDDTITLSTTYPSRGEACRICVQKIEKRKVKRDGVCPYTPCTHRARNPEPTNDMVTRRIRNSVLLSPWEARIPSFFDVHTHTRARNTEIWKKTWY